MLSFLLLLGLLISILPFTEQFEIQADGFNITQIDPKFKVRDKRQAFLKNRPGFIDPYCRTCGVSASATLQARITNGVPVRPRWKYPWAVPMTIWGGTDFPCGGALITREFVLTAAHCIRNPLFVESDDCIIYGRVVSCYLGPRDISVALMGESHYIPIAMLKLAEIYVHPQYDFWRNHNDVALLQLARPLTNCNRYIAPICLPTRPLSKRGQQVVVAGWGRIVYNELETPQTFREGRMVEVDPSYCQRKNQFPERRRKKIYCTTGTRRFNQSSCMGDSGSSVFASFNGVFYSLGVTSFGSSFCTISDYVNYANTHGYLDFILPIVGTLPKPPSRFY